MTPSFAIPANASGRPSALRVTAVLAVSLACTAWVWQVAHSYVAPVKAAVEVGSADENAARAALRKQPLNSAALRDLALALGGNGNADRNLLNLAARVSRREPATQLLLLDANAQEGEIAAALRNYDALLSTEPELQTKLLGLLAGALPEPEVYAEVLRYAGRPWFVALLDTAAAQPGSAVLALRLALGTGLLAQPETRERLAPRLIGALSVQGRVQDARDIAQTIGQAGWQDIGFSEASLDPRLANFAWQMTGSPSVAAEWRAPSSLAVSIEPGRRMQVARRVTSLAGGTYVLRLEVAAPSPPAARIEWQIKCSTPAAADILTFQIPAASTPITVEKQLTIPAACAFQDWSLWAEGADAQLPSQAVLSKLAVTRQ